MVLNVFDFLKIALYFSVHFGVEDQNILVHVDLIYVLFVGFGLLQDHN